MTMNVEEIAKAYNPKDTEDKWYQVWEEEGYFQAKEDGAKQPFTIVIPPPNVTGILHMGHALNNTIQDILIRYHRMAGENALWMPGTDHAGIATQNVVERKLAAEGKTRETIGREKFIKEVWQWKEEYGSTIIRQLKKLGCSCDWPRERFTMDEGLSLAVSQVFIQLYEKGLIIRDNYIINWCPRCQTALSDEESEHENLGGHLYYIKYPLENSHDEITVATTRPETMLGDVAVAVHPQDQRYKDLIGKNLILPVVKRPIPIIGDERVDKEFGTGAVKVTPAHDPNDFLMGQRHGLTPIVVMNPDATMNEQAGDYEGMDRFECRKALVLDLEQRHLLKKKEPHQHSVGHCYRCHTVIEPYISDQWFVKMEALAQPAIKAVEEGRIKFYPQRWKKVYLEWMYNIRNWCISRQIWWGHRIPVWYCSSNDCKPIASIEKPKACPNCKKKKLTQDPDVLDTWFSSWLWPFSTFGWPEENTDLNYFYPTSVLVTAPEIIFFWVARMIMAGLEFRGEIPFKDVYIHGTVRDDKGTKMSKSLGNVIDPLEIIEDYGTDALRFSLMAITSVGQDVFLSRDKFELGRNFANKIWNASRFILMNVADKPFNKNILSSFTRSTLDLPENQANTPLNTLSLADKWILSRLSQAMDQVTESLNKYRFNEATSLLYDFFWHEFCDWYLEMVKPLLYDQQNEDQAATARAVLCYVLEKSLRILHPFMPFITEEIWQNLKQTEYAIQQPGKSIMTAQWPKANKELFDPNIEKDFSLVIEIITAIRNIRSSVSIKPSDKIETLISVPGEDIKETLLKYKDYLISLSGIKDLRIDINIGKPKMSGSAVISGIAIYVPLKGLIDIDQEKERLNKQIEKLQPQLKGIQKKLDNDNFISKAPEEVVKKEKTKEQDLIETIQKLNSLLSMLE